MADLTGTAKPPGGPKPEMNLGMTSEMLDESGRISAAIAARENESRRNAIASGHVGAAFGAPVDAVAARDGVGKISLNVADGEVTHKTMYLQPGDPRRHAKCTADGSLSLDVLESVYRPDPVEDALAVVTEMIANEKAVAASKAHDSEVRIAFAREIAQEIRMRRLDAERKAAPRA